MSWSDLWKDVRDRLAPPKTVPAREAIDRIRESSGRFPVVTAPMPAASSPSPVVTPFAEEVPPPTIAPPDWAVVFPGHYRALVADLAKRGEDIGHWEIRDGRDLGVAENGHTVSFTLHKTGTSASIRVELTMYKGRLSNVRVH